MKKLLLIISMIAMPTIAHAEHDLRKLVCSGGENSFKKFDAVLDYSAYDKGSGFFRVRNAGILDNYASARLICSGHELKEIDCVGFWFDRGDLVAQVKIREVDGKLVAAYRTLTGDRLIKGGPIPCEVLQK